MIKEKTLLILGAGASWPYYFPTGAELKEYILKRFPGDYANLVQKSTTDRFIRNDVVRFFDKFIEKFSNPMYPSIDLFLSLNHEFEEIGKIAIVFTILSAELNKELFRMKRSLIDEFDWYQYLFRALTEDITKLNKVNRIFDNQIKIITFNYDRSFENYISSVLINAYPGLDQDTKTMIYEKLKPIHVFGSPNLTGENAVNYGSVLEVNKLESFSKSINTIYEIESDDRFRDMIIWAEKIFFLGFGFAPENLEVLGIPKYIKPNHKIYATALNLSERRKKSIINLLHDDYCKKQNFSHGSYSQSHYLNSVFHIESEMDSVKLLDKYLNP